ncbi:MAG TPA: hypothetical protein VJV79_28705 [Polyangiaceae bacterium]|nr:hypothetical protein [Polyangiaceae bacterium]
MNICIKISAVVCLSFLAACGAENDAQPSLTSEQAAQSPDVAPVSDATSVSAAAPVPVAALTLENGNVVEFYNFGRRVLMSEIGSVKNPPAATPKGRLKIDRLVDTWKELAPNQPVPAALSELQDRLIRTAPAGSQERPISVGQTQIRGEVLKLEEKTTLPSAPGVEQTGIVRQAVPQGCNNGCCDYPWLATFEQCAGGWDYSWFLYNYGWSYANVPNAEIYKGLVCSAVGTSTYKVNIVGEGLGGTWAVLEAHYRTWYWYDDYCLWFCSNEDITSSVNTSTNAHLHTYCGMVKY